MQFSLSAILIAMTVLEHTLASAVVGAGKPILTIAIPPNPYEEGWRALPGDAPPAPRAQLSGGAGGPAAAQPATAVSSPKPSLKRRRTDDDSG